MKKSQRGAALILALMILSFLAVLGGALLTSSTLDIWIADNYKTRTQSLYLAEGGLEEAREKLRVAGVPPFGRAESFVSGTSGFGKYSVSLREGIVGGTVMLVSVAEAGSSRKTIEITVVKGSFPELAEDGSTLDPRARTANGLELLVDSISANASNLFGGPVAIANYGSESKYGVAVAEGDCTLGPGTGFGLLLVRGKLTFSGPFLWTGLIAVIGEGVVQRTADAAGEVVGGLFIARTLDDAPAVSDLSGIIVRHDPLAMAKANESFPYTPIMIREY